MGEAEDGSSDEHIISDIPFTNGEDEGHNDGRGIEKYWEDCLQSEKNVNFTVELMIGSGLHLIETAANFYPTANDKNINRRIITAVG